MAIKDKYKNKHAEQMSARHYPVKYRASDYTFPTDDAIETVCFDDTYLHIELVDGRILSVPLAWIPSLRDAPPAEREKVQISPDRSLLFWDPDKGEINEILRLSDYLVTRALDETGR